MTLDEWREETKNYIEEYAESIGALLERESETFKQYTCPLCGSGNHATAGSDGAFTIYPESKRFRCYSCNSSGDIFDLIKQFNGVTLAEADKIAEDFTGIHMTDEASEETKEAVKEAKAREIQRDFAEMIQGKDEKGKTLADEIADTLGARGRKDRTPFYRRLSHSCDYLEKRGISKETAEKFKIGYKKDYPYSKEGTWSTALIIPVSDYSYTARRADDSKERPKVVHSAGGGSDLMNIEALEAKTSEPLYICEGEIDLLSFEEIGADALALRSATNAQKFIDLIKRHADEISRPLVFAMDNDKDGQEAERKIIEGLSSTGIVCKGTAGKLYGSEKDANDALTKDREAFAQLVKSTSKEMAAQYINAVIDPIEPAEKPAEGTAKKEPKKVKVWKMSEAIELSYKRMLDDPIRPTPTGFKFLDRALDGGLYEGLYVIGAIPGLGKTALTMQMAEQMAEKGKPVLIFALEMSAQELATRSISRRSYELSKEYAATQRDIQTGAAGDDVQQLENLIWAKAEAQKVAENIAIFEGNPTAQEIVKLSEEYKEETGKKPIILIDYLQIITNAGNPGATQRQVTDDAVTAFKQLSRELQTTVILISSLSRASYDSDGTMSAFKESGCIEYTADFLATLEYQDQKHPVVNGVKKVKLSVLKNRAGRDGAVINFDNVRQFFFFKDTTTKLNNWHNYKAILLDDFETALIDMVDPEGTPKSWSDLLRCERTTSQIVKIHSKAYKLITPAPGSKNKDTEEDTEAVTAYKVKARTGEVVPVVRGRLLLVAIDPITSLPCTIAEGDFKKIKQDILFYRQEAGTSCDAIKLDK